MRATYRNGHFYGRLLCLRQVGADKNGDALWLCLCDCGAIVIVPASSLRRGSTKSCGCLQREQASRRMAILGVSSSTHRMSKTRIYKRWAAAKQRCSNIHNKDYADYGGRGITMCAGCQEFQVYRDVLGQQPSNKHQVDRIENDLGYWCGACEECLANGWPMNLQWSTSSQNCRNKRNNIKIIVGGVEMTIAGASDATGVPYSLILKRLQRGMSDEDAIKIPPGIGSHLVIANGETMRVFQWSEKTGIPQSTILARLLRLGWSDHDAVTIPAGGRRVKNAV